MIQKTFKAFLFRKKFSIRCAMNKKNKSPLTNYLSVVDNNDTNSISGNVSRVSISSNDLDDLNEEDSFSDLDF